FGVRIRQDVGKVIVANVLSASPAEKCGIAAQDEIIGIDGLRMDSSRLLSCIVNKKPGSAANLLLSRSGELLETKVEVASKPIMEYKIAKLDESTYQQKLLFNSWLDADWNEEIRYEDYPPSPARKLVLDYI
ncbi:MAG: PDZ domain-containing protein, partial [Rhabdochlamydiaceae bacterium]